MKAVERGITPASDPQQKIISGGKEKHKRQIGEGEDACAIANVPN